MPKLLLMMNLYLRWDNGTDTALFYFSDADGGGDANGSEAVLLATLTGVADATDIVYAKRHSVNQT